MIYCTHSNYKETGMAMLIVEKVYFKTRNMTRKKGGIQNNKWVSLMARHNNLKYVFL